MLSKLKTQKQFEEDNIIKNIRNLFKLKTENKAIKDRITRDIRTHFWIRKKFITILLEYAIFGTRILMAIKVTIVKIKTYQWKNTLMKLNPT